VMIVLSDGEPCCGTVRSSKLGRNLHEVIKGLNKEQIKVVGIGIRTKAVKEFYEKNVVIDTLEDLPGAVMKQLGDLVLSR